MKLEDQRLSEQLQTSQESWELTEDQLKKQCGHLEARVTELSQQNSILHGEAEKVSRVNVLVGLKAPNASVRYYIGTYVYACFLLIPYVLHPCMHMYIHMHMHMRMYMIQLSARILTLQHQSEEEGVTSVMTDTPTSSDKSTEQLWEIIK